MPWNWMTLTGWLLIWVCGSVLLFFGLKWFLNLKSDPDHNEVD